VEGKSVEEKGAKAAGMTVAWRGLSGKDHSNVWWSFTRNGLGGLGHGLQMSYSSCQDAPEQQTTSEASYLG